MSDKYVLVTGGMEPLVHMFVSILHYMDKNQLWILQQPSKCCSYRKYVVVSPSSWI